MGAFFNGERATQLMLTRAHLPDDVLDDDHRPINDETEVNRAETHQISRNTQTRHAGEGEQKRKGNCQGHDQRRAPVAQQHKKNHDHEARALE